MFKTATHRLTEAITEAVNHNLQDMNLGISNQGQMSDQINDFVKAMLINSVSANWDDKPSFTITPIAKTRRVIESAHGHTLVSNIRYKPHSSLSLAPTID